VKIDKHLLNAQSFVTEESEIKGLRAQLLTTNTTNPSCLEMLTQ
jgi:photosystem II stability/assembly factor-like uncharacterized protein